MSNMSKAFTKDDDDGGVLVVRPRAPLHADTPNYVTARGLDLLRAELEKLQSSVARLGSADSELDKRAERAAVEQRIVALEARLRSAVVVPRPMPAPVEARFGASVRVRSSDGADHEYRIVGVDEADARHGLLAFTSPVARALVGKRAGESISVRTPRGEQEVEILSVSYDE